MRVASETVHRGRLKGDAIGASIKVAACEAVGLQHDHPGIRLRGFAFVGEPKSGSLPDVLFDIVERRPTWWAQ